MGAKDHMPVGERAFRAAVAGVSVVAGVAVTLYLHGAPGAGVPLWLSLFAAAAYSVFAFFGLWVAIMVLWIMGMLSAISAGLTDPFAGEGEDVLEVEVDADAELGVRR